MRTEFEPLASREELPAQGSLRLARENAWQRVATHASALTDFAIPSMKLPTLHTDAGYEKAELERCDAGITACDALVAQTGGVLITAGSAGGRTLSVLPPHHVVLATRAQLVPDLPAAFALLAAALRAAMAELHFLHHRSEPHRGYRTHPRPRARMVQSG